MKLDEPGFKMRADDVAGNTRLSPPLMVLRSCVPMATRVRRRQMFWCSLSCRSMKLAYRSVGPGRHCSPRHRMPLPSKNEVSQRVTHAVASNVCSRAWQMLLVTA